MCRLYPAKPEIRPRGRYQPARSAAVPIWQERIGSFEEEGMRTRFGLTLALVLGVAFPAAAQRLNEGQPGEGQHEQGRGSEAHGPNTPRANQVVRIDPDHHRF